MTSTDQDSDLKRRFHRLLWYQGFFVRREIAISTHMVGSGHQLQRRDVTDIDVLGVRFSEGLGRETVLTECKSGRNFNGLDGTLKLAGLMQLLGAARSYLVVDRPENLAKRVAPRLGIQVIDGRRLSAWESAVVPENNWRGPFAPEMDQKLEEAFAEVKDSSYLEYFYARYRFWQEEPADQLKRTLSVLRGIRDNAGLSTPARECFLAHVLPLVGVAIVGIASRMFAFNPADRKEFITQVVTEWHGGELMERRHKALVDQVQAMIRQEAEQAGITKRQASIQSFLPEPEYVSSALAELIARLMANPAAAAQIPRFMDMLFFDFVLKGKPAKVALLVKDFGTGQDLHAVAKLASDVVALAESASALNLRMFLDGTRLA